MGGIRTTNRKGPKLQKSSGVSLIEILITIAISALLVAIGFASFKDIKARYDLNSAAHTLYSDIIWCQQKSMGAPHSLGISFSAHKYIVFRDTNDNGVFDNGTDTKIQERELNHITLSGYPQNGFVYSRRGIASSTFTVTLTNDMNQRKQISVSLFKARIRNG